jgi:hypothetical protein
MSALRSTERDKRMVSSNCRTPRQTTARQGGRQSIGVATGTDYGLPQSGRIYTPLMRGSGGGDDATNSDSGALLARAQAR